MSQYYPITHELKTLFTAPRGKLATAGEQIDTPNVLIWVPAAGLSNSLNYESRGELKTIWRVSSVYSGYRRWVEFSDKLHASSRLSPTGRRMKERLDTVLVKGKQTSRRGN